MLGSGPIRADTAKVTPEEPETGPEVEARYWTLEQVARYLSSSTPQVYALVRSGELPAIKLGGRGVWRVDRRQLDDYLDKLQADTAEWTKAHPLNPRDRAGTVED